MKKSFTQIATEVVEELYPADEENTPDINVESIVKRLLRQFTKFIEIMGGKVEELQICLFGPYFICFFSNYMFNYQEVM